MILPTATYRLQLRGGVDFAAARALLPYLADLGISHLYLSPIFAAAAGSTHGYDVIDPNRIEPSLGGREGFAELSRAARDIGLGIIIDIVPNHTAFTTDNPWLRDVLRHGANSAYARHFDIDWNAGRLVLPFLPGQFEDLLADEAIAVDTDSNEMTVGDLRVPLAPGSLPDAADATDPDTLRSLHDAQVWQLTHWHFERDGVTHRRFFNVTGLIGMRVDDDPVWNDMHRLVLDLVHAGEVQGLRLDHIDGLADPAAYLRRLRDAVGDLPVWVEKILTGDETLPADWPVQGTTGYEAGRNIARVLTDPAGVARIDRAWRDATGIEGTFHDALVTAKDETIRHDLAAELHQLIALSRSALEASQMPDVGDESLREAILGLLMAFPRYRTYFHGAEGRDEDRALMQAVTGWAARGLRNDAVLRRISAAITDPVHPADVTLQERFQQVTGALLAKSHEDTAGFRFNRYLAANEVGADPDQVAMTADAFSDWLTRHPASALSLTSSHDTKRSEDARMRLVAISHLPDRFEALWHDASALPGATDFGPNRRWYVVQSLLAMWQPGRRDLPERMRAHVTKALREAMVVTNWAHPDEDAEAPVLEFAQSLARRWTATPPDALLALVVRAQALSLAQLALKLAMPGIPDIYQGCEVGSFRLTDPDNRAPVDFKALAQAQEAEGFDGDKARLTRRLLHLRRDHSQFLVEASAVAESDGKVLVLTRRREDRFLTVRIPHAGAPVIETDLD